jgi:phosphate transport system substrate-binding protein
MSRFRRRHLVVAMAAAVTPSMVGAACGSGSGTSTGDSALSGRLPGSGATFPKVFYEESIAELMGVSPLEVTYAGGGSGTGKDNLKDEVVTWAGTDSPISDEDLPGFPGTVLYFPTVAAPITVSYDLPSVEDLQLAPDTVAGIFQGDITNWNAEEIAADNPGAALPDQSIIVARRSDGSGTTKNFTKYLEAAAPDTWKLGGGDTVEWPVDSQGGNGNAGVAEIVLSNEGAIGYVDLSEANALGLTAAAIKNSSGNYVKPTLEAASAALESTEIEDDLTYDPLDAEGAEAYPITAPTWIITYVEQDDQATVDNLKGWLTYILTDAQALADELDYAVLPSGLQQQAMDQLDMIKVAS